MTANPTLAPPDGVPLELVAEILDELLRSRAKHPGNRMMLAALHEETGEVARAVLEQDRAAIRREAVQVIVVAIRLIQEGDSTADVWREQQGLQPSDPRSNTARPEILACTPGERPVAVGEEEPLQVQP